MNQQERSRLSRARILSYAEKEFAESGYIDSSVNRICTNGKISKGLLYHYFKDKDTLYLACVSQCFQKITKEFLSDLDPETFSVDEYFDRRQVFFENNPVCFYLFLDAMTNRTAHLQEALLACRAEFEQINTFLITKIMDRMGLLDAVDREEAVTLYKIMVCGFHSYMYPFGEEKITASYHSALGKKALLTLLYGLHSLSQNS